MLATHLIQWIRYQVRAPHFDVEKQHSHVWHLSSLNFCNKTFLFTKRKQGTACWLKYAYWYSQLQYESFKATTFSKRKLKNTNYYYIFPSFTIPRIHYLTSLHCKYATFWHTDPSSMQDIVICRTYYLSLTKFEVRTKFFSLWPRWETRGP